jgi:biopolymer transport protein ExbB/biopolymer transport protein TolQ
MTYGPVEIWQSMGLVGRSVLVFLILMSVYSIAVMIDRYILFSKARTQSLRFVEAAKGLLAKGKLDETLKESKKYRKSHLARVYSAAIYDFSGYADKENLGLGFEDTIRRAIEREAFLVAQDFKRGLSGLASIGATAPFVGLFGTVVGIMNAFFGMAVAGAGGIGAVAGGIAEALVNTAVGLFVALPAVWAFNYFLGRMERFTVEMNNAGSELVDYFVKNYRSQAWKSAAASR